MKVEFQGPFYLGRPHFFAHNRTHITFPNEVLLEKLKGEGEPYFSPNQALRNTFSIYQKQIVWMSGKRPITLSL